MLILKDVQAGYGNIKVLKGVSLEVPDRRIVTLLGANGAGKTTTARTIVGLTSATGGTIEFNGARIDKLGPDKMIGRGIALVPQGRLLFPELTVDENLQLGAYTRRDSAEVRLTAEKAYAQFPILKQKHKQDAGTLSGGQQQMLAIARALMTNPKLILIDEPSLGLAPKVVDEVYDRLVQLQASRGLTLLIVEQSSTRAARVGGRMLLMRGGRIVADGDAAGFAAHDLLSEAYFGEPA